MKKVTIVELLICLTALSIIFCWLYNRIFKKKLIVALSEDNISKYQEYFSIVCYFNIYMLVLTVFTGAITYYYVNYKTVIKESIISKFAAKVSSVLDYLNIFYKTYVIIFNFISPLYLQYLVTFAKIVLSFTRLTSYIIIVVFVILPRVLILLVLLTEIYFGALYFYFFSLLLLLIPQIFSLLLFMLKDVGPRVLPKLKKFVFQRDINYNETVDVATSVGIKKCTLINYYIAPGYEDLDIDEVMEDLYKPCLFIEPHIRININPRVFIASFITRIIYYTITIACFAYILY